MFSTQLYIISFFFIIIIIIIIIIIMIIIIIIIIIIIMMIINCGLWDLLDVKSEAGLLLTIMPFRPQT